MLSKWLGYEARRKQQLKRAPEGALRDFLSVPFPPPDSDIYKTPILAVDFETTGLDPKSHHILSIGSIALERGDIRLQSAYHQVINTEGDLSESNVVIHQIRDLDKANYGTTVEASVNVLLKALAGHVMLVHFARIEKTFLQRICKQIYGMAPDFPIIDTLDLCKKRLDKKNDPYAPTELRLFNLRRTYTLPAYGAHNALSDALATAELLLAELSLQDRDKHPPLKHFLL